MAVETHVRETLCPAAVRTLSASPPDTRDRCGRRDPYRPCRQAPVARGTTCAARTVASHELRNRRRPRRRSRGLRGPRRLARYDELPYGPADERAHIVGHMLVVLAGRMTPTSTGPPSTSRRRRGSGRATASPRGRRLCHRHSWSPRERTRRRRLGNVGAAVDSTPVVSLAGSTRGALTVPPVVGSTPGGR